ncbi:DGQHR domain-containing protein [Bacillus hominis]|uniref:DGQHR domain-containing protein n=1 Tax=Bacillus hominis TaxID=2817478 RepID=UPI001BB311D4|nr:DGQHR domain-containing protein [Bacillus hominis]
MKKAYSKKKEELLRLVTEIRKNVGNTLKLKLVKLEQGNEYEMYTSTIAVNESIALVRRIPRDYDNPGGIQRALKDVKIKEICEKALDTAKFSSPNAVIMNLYTNRDGKRPHLADIVTFEQSLVTPKEAVYVIDLIKYEEKLKAITADEDGYLNAEDEALLFLGVLIDSHHRTEGFYLAGRMEIELTVTVYLDLPNNDMARIFIDINEKQEKPSPVHTLAMKAIAGVLAGTDETADTIIKGLNDNPQSILYQRIKDIDGKRPESMKKTYVTNSTFLKLLKDQIIPYLSTDMSKSRQIDLLNDYFTAWSLEFPEAWEDTKHHILVKSMGFQIMMRLFNTLHSRVSVSGITPNITVYRNIIKKTLKNGKTLNIEGNMEFLINWESGCFGGYSSGKGIGIITTALTQHIASQNFVAPIVPSKKKIS